MLEKIQGHWLVSFFRKIVIFIFDFITFKENHKVGKNSRRPCCTGIKKNELEISEFFKNQYLNDLD